MRLRTGAVAAFGVAAFAAGWERGHVSGIRCALRMVQTLRRHAECRADEDGCRWVYPPGHPREGEPFGEHPDGELHFVEREARRYRPFAGLPLLETLEFDAAGRSPRRPLPPDLPPWGEWPTGGTGVSESLERKRQ